MKVQLFFINVTSTVSTFILYYLNIRKHSIIYIMHILRKVRSMSSMLFQLLSILQISCICFNMSNIIKYSIPKYVALYLLQCSVWMPHPTTIAMLFCGLVNAKWIFFWIRCWLFFCNANWNETKNNSELYRNEISLCD